MVYIRCKVIYRFASESLSVIFSDTFCLNGTVNGSAAQNNRGFVCSRWVDTSVIYKRNVITDLECDKVDSKKVIYRLLTILLLSILLVKPIAQKYYYNKYSIFLSGTLMFCILFFMSYFLFHHITSIRLERNNLKKNVGIIAQLIVFYSFFTLFMFWGVFGVLSGLVSNDTLDNNPEYAAYIIPTLSGSMLFLYRVLGMFENDKYIQIHQINISIFDVKRVLGDWLIGIFVLVIPIVTVASIAGNNDTLTMGTLTLGTILAFSTILVIIETVIWWCLNNPPIEYKYEEFVRNNIFFGFFTIGLISLIALIIMSFINAPAVVYQNATTLSVSVTEVNTQEIHLWVNDTAAIIPLLIVEGKERPLTGKLGYWVDENIKPYNSLNISLKVSTKPDNYPINPNVKTTPILNCEPADYDSIIIYTLYKSGHHELRSTCVFRDRATLVFKDKFFFDFNSTEKVLIHVSSTDGAIGEPVGYDIEVVTQNATLGNHIKSAIKELDDSRKAGVIFVNNDPEKRPLFANT